MRIGVFSVGDPRSPATWSGTPAGVISGFETLGAEVVTLDARTRSGLERLIVGSSTGWSVISRRVGIGAARATGRRSAALHVARTARLRAVASNAPAFDGVVQIGTDFLLPDLRCPAVSFEDMTIPQALSAGYVAWCSASEQLVQRRIALQGRTYQRVDACCFTSHWAASSAIAEYRIASQKVRVVGVGANHIVTAVGRVWRPPRFLFVGKDWQRKNGDQVVRAFAIIRNEFPDATLHLVGDIPPIVSPGVHVHGPLRLSRRTERSRLETLFRQATVFVLPSTHEPSALAYVEAGHAELPSVVSGAGGSPELVGNGGVVVRPGDLAALVEAMRRLCDPDLAKKMGMAAQERARLYTWELVAGRLLRAMELGDKPASADFL